MFPGCVLTRSVYTAVVDAHAKRLLPGRARLIAESLDHVQLWHAAGMISGGKKWMSKEPNKSWLMRQTKTLLRRLEEGVSVESLIHCNEDGT